MESKHTPEPWSYKPEKHDDWGFIRSESGTLVAIAKNSDVTYSQEDGYRLAKQDPYALNGNRIVACVNACAGLDEAQIEQLAKWNQSPSSVPYFDLVAKNRILQKELDDMKAQRDALLRACKAVMGGGYGCAPSVGYMDELKQKCEAAIRITEPNYNTN